MINLSENAIAFVYDGSSRMYFFFNTCMIILGELHKNQKFTKEWVQKTVQANE